MKNKITKKIIKPIKINYEGRILFLDSEIPSIYFPVGKPSIGGSCNFRNPKQCSIYCPSGQVQNKYEIYALKYFKNNSISNIIDKIIESYLFYINTIPHSPQIIQWFTWGDCLPELVNKISQIIIELSKLGINQYGSTRNFELWEAVPAKCNLALTFDNLEIAKYVSTKWNKRTCVPDVKTTYGLFILGGEIIARCSGYWYIDNKELRESDCNQCLWNKEGCFKILK